MTIKLWELDNLVREVAPIEGLNSAGVISFRVEATAEQRVAAQAIVAARLADLDLTT